MTLSSTNIAASVCIATIPWPGAMMMMMIPYIITVTYMMRSLVPRLQVFPYNWRALRSRYNEVPIHAKEASHIYLYYALWLSILALSLRISRVKCIYRFVKRIY